MKKGYFRQQSHCLAQYFPASNPQNIIRCSAENRGKNKCEC